ncbi:MAG: biopolymer transporter ExbD [Treponema sp.]|nr:biopolymer transporter ExbD [Treponema sp.]
MKLRRERKKITVPMNAMSDVAFLLLIFIMLVSLINYRREIKIDYPEADKARRTSAEKNLEIWIDGYGELYLEGLPAELETIENALGETYRSAPDTRVHIIADKNVPYGSVNGVIEILQLLEYRVISLVVRGD